MLGVGRLGSVVCGASVPPEVLQMLLRAEGWRELQAAGDRRAPEPQPRPRRLRRRTNQRPALALS